MKIINVRFTLANVNSRIEEKVNEYKHSSCSGRKLVGNRRDNLSTETIEKRRVARMNRDLYSEAC